MWLHYQMCYLDSLMIYLPYWICFHQQMRIIDIYENILALNFFFCYKPKGVLLPLSLSSIMEYLSSKVTKHN